MIMIKRFLTNLTLNKVVAFISLASAVVGLYDFCEQKMAPILASYEVHDVLLLPKWLPASTHLKDGPRINGVVTDNVYSNNPQTTLTIFKIKVKKAGSSHGLIITLPDVTRPIAATARLEGLRNQIVSEGVKINYDESKFLLTLSGFPELQTEEILYVYLWADYAQFSGPEVRASNEAVKTIEADTFSGIARFLATFWVWGMILCLIIILWEVFVYYSPKNAGV